MSDDKKNASPPELSPRQKVETDEGLDPTTQSAEADRLREARRSKLAKRSAGGTTVMSKKEYETVNLKNELEDPTSEVTTYATAAKASGLYAPQSTKGRGGIMNGYPEIPEKRQKTHRQSSEEQKMRDRAAYMMRIRGR